MMQTDLNTPPPDAITPITLPAIPKREETWRREDGILTKRMTKALLGRKVAVLFACITCMDERRDPTIVAVRHEVTNEVELRCQCTIRRLEGVR